MKKSFLGTVFFLVAGAGVAIGSLLSPGSNTKRNERDAAIGRIKLAIDREDFGGVTTGLTILARDHAHDKDAQWELFNGIQDCLKTFGYTKQIAAMTRELAKHAGTEELATKLLILSNDFDRCLPAPPRGKPVLKIVSSRDKPQDGPQ